MPGIVAVPAAPPGRNRVTSSVEAIFEASQPSLILSTAAHRRLAEQSYGHLSAAVRAAVDRHRRGARRPPAARGAIRSVDGRQTAFLQYTSGSTSSPKGVMLSHENLLHNAALIQQAFGNTPDGSGVFWLPLYHDMGLIGGVVQPVYCGGSCTLLAPAAFLQRPALWLETISQTRGHASAAAPTSPTTCASARFRPRNARGWT